MKNLLLYPFAKCRFITQITINCKWIGKFVVSVIYRMKEKINIQILNQFIQSHFISFTFNIQRFWNKRFDFQTYLYIKYEEKILNLFGSNSNRKQIKVNQNALSRYLSK